LCPIRHYPKNSSTAVKPDAKLLGFPERPTPVLFRSRYLGNCAEAEGAVDVEALGIALAHELTRMNEDTPLLASDARGGLPHWQQKKLTQYIEEHLADEVSLVSLAQLAQLSPYHFSRAFKQSFGMPPHQYLTSRRIERAKTLLAERKLSVTEIGFDVGFSGSFTAAFRWGGMPRARSLA
jgi:AraC-like DNA-binding protein